MNIGNTIRTRRRAQDRTQENLAELLGVTVSAVSLWESGKTMPDIALIPAICSVLDISADELFEIDLEKKEADVAEIIDEAHRFGERGYTAEALAVLEAGLKKYPDHPRLLSDAMHYHHGAYCRHGEEHHREKALELGERILEKCTDIPQRYSAIQVLVFLYRDTDPNRVQQLLEQTEDICVSRDVLATRAYRGDEQIRADQHLIQTCVDLLTRSLTENPKADSGEGRYTRQEQMTVYEKAITIFHILFEDGDFGFYHTRLQDAECALADFYADQKDAEAALAHLEKEAFHAAEFVKFADFGADEFIHTSLVLRGLKNGGFSTNSSTNNAQEVLNRMDHARWDFVRETEEFCKIRDFLTGYAGEWQKKA